MSKPKPPSPEALALLEAATALPSLDELLARDPATYTVDDLEAVFSHARTERALWALKERANDDKKAEKEANA